MNLSTITKMALSEETTVGIDAEEIFITRCNHVGQCTDQILLTREEAKDLLRFLRETLGASEGKSP